MIDDPNKLYQYHPVQRNNLRSLRARVNELIDKEYIPIEGLKTFIEKDEDGDVTWYFQLMVHSSLWQKMNKYNTYG